MMIERSKTYQDKTNGAFVAIDKVTDHVTFYPVGGGFAYRMILADFLRRFEQAEIPDKWEPARFCFDFSPFAVPGYHNPHRRWNGWAMPFLTRESVDLLLKDLSTDYLHWWEGDQLFMIDIDGSDLQGPLEVDRTPGSDKLFVVDANGKVMTQDQLDDEGTLAIVSPTKIGAVDHYDMSNGWTWSIARDYWVINPKGYFFQIDGVIENHFDACEYFEFEDDAMVRVADITGCEPDEIVPNKIDATPEGVFDRVHGRSAKIAELLVDQCGKGAELEKVIRYVTDFTL